MTVELDEVIRVGTVAIAALAQRSVHCGRMDTVAVHGTKRPVAILIRRDDTTLAFEIDGAGIDLDDLERRFPGQCAEFERSAKGSLER